ncbi:hypothetical protein GCM10027053_14800 [Intrasporangium mesophilum]
MFAAAGALVAASLLASAGDAVGVQPAPGSGGGALVDGILTDHGRALGAADVVAVAWPNQQTLQGLTEGEMVATYVIGRTKTDGAGRFKIDTETANIPAQFRGEGDLIDVELVFGDSTREAHWHYSAAPGAGRGWIRRGGSGKAPDFRGDVGTATGYDLADDPAAWVGPDGKALGISKGRGQVTLSISKPDRSFDQLRHSPLSQLRAARATAHGRLSPEQMRSAGANLTAVPTEICQSYAGTIHYGLSEYFLRAFGWSGAYATVIEQVGNDHTLGIGFSATGSETGFRASGSQSTNMSAGGERSGVADAYAWNKVNYRDYGDSCSASKTRKPLGVYALLTNFTYTPHQVMLSCTTYAAGKYTKSQGTNVTYSSGMDIGPINVSAQSGWNTNTEVQWSLTKRTKICGSTSAGWVSAPEASASQG